MIRNAPRSADGGAAGRSPDARGVAPIRRERLAVEKRETPRGRARPLRWGALLLCAATTLFIEVHGTHAQSRSNPSSASRSRPADGSYGDFAIITQRNIFVKNRRQPQSRPSATTNPSGESSGGPRRAEQAYLLTGIILQDDGRYVAFVENAGTNQTVKVGVGDDVVRGKVAEIGFDYLEYESAAGRTRVEIGKNLAGGAGVVVSSGSSSSPASSGSTSASSPSGAPPSAAEAAILERMRQRRAQETQR